MKAFIAVALGCLVKFIVNVTKKYLEANRRRRRPVFHLRSLVSTVNHRLLNRWTHIHFALTSMRGSF
jgi:hypothetical protein